MANDWIQVGARVAEYTYGGANAHVRFATIGRLTATQVVLDNGERYNRTTLHRVGGDRSGWGSRTVLEDPAADRVKTAYAAKVVSDTLYRISVITRRDVRGVAVLDEIDRLVARARSLIADTGESERGDE